MDLPSRVRLLREARLLQAQPVSDLADLVDVGEHLVVADEVPVDDHDGGGLLRGAQGVVQPERPLEKQVRGQCVRGHSPTQQLTVDSGSQRCLSLGCSPSPSLQLLVCFFDVCIVMEQEFYEGCIIVSGCIVESREAMNVLMVDISLTFQQNLGTVYGTALCCLNQGCPLKLINDVMPAHPHKKLYYFLFAKHTGPMQGIPLEKQVRGQCVRGHFPTQQLTVDSGAQRCLSLGCSPSPSLQLQEYNRKLQFP